MLSKIKFKKNIIFFNEKLIFKIKYYKDIRFKKNLFEKLL
jgi:hypothetical protein